MRPFPHLDQPEFAIFEKLTTPEKIQDFIDILPVNFEPNSDTSRSPLMTLREGRAHCMEGALIAASALWYHGEPPLLLDLKTTKGDDDHVVTLFKRHGRWGAISKTNHAVLRYRDAIYRSVRELVMSYFHEYFLDSGRKTLRSFSRPFNLLRYGSDWLTSKGDLWYINNDLDDSPHTRIIKPKMEKLLRKADKIEIKAGKLVEWKKPK